MINVIIGIIGVILMFACVFLPFGLLVFMVGFAAFLGALFTA